MAVPKHRTSKQKKRSRRSHDFLKEVNLVTCLNCGIKKQLHIVCNKCGFYKGKFVIKLNK